MFSTNTPLHKGSAKDTKRATQLKAVFVAFFKAPKTMQMVAEETGIYRANICRYCRTFRKKGVIRVVKTGRCEITRHKAGYLSTNPQFFPPQNQLKLWS